MVLNFNKIKACDSSLSIILINFKRVRIPSFNRESLSGIICVANQKNKIVDKLGWLFTDSNSYYVIYINYYKVAYYLGTGVKFRITTKTSVGIILHISRGMTYFFHGCHDYHLRKCFVLFYKMKRKVADYLFSNFLVRDSFFNEISVTSMFEEDSPDKFDIDFETVFFQNQNAALGDSDFFSMNQSAVFDRKEIVRPFVLAQSYPIEIRDRFESTKIKKAASVQSGFFSFSFYPGVGDIVYVAYFDYDLSERFMLGRCVYVFKNNIFSYFSLYQKSYGFFITFYISSPCFIGFCVVSLPNTFVSIV